MEKLHYLIEGRVIPERALVEVPMLKCSRNTASESAIDFVFYVIKSKIFIHASADTDVMLGDIKNVAFAVIGDVINYAAFQRALGLSYELDSITNMSDRSTSVFGGEGYVFDDAKEFSEKITFPFSDNNHAITLNLKTLGDPTFGRATFELRNSIKHPDFTALHCRLAIEAIRSAFDADNEASGWEKLRASLKIRRETIESFKDAADKQRHGRNLVQTWEQRRRSMQIAWEIVYRYTRYIENGNALNAPEF